MVKIGVLESEVLYSLGDSLILVSKNLFLKSKNCTSIFGNRRSTDINYAIT